MFMRPVLVAVLMMTGACGSLSDVADVRVGETVGLKVNTHCGVESADINGQVWNAVELLYATPEKLGPPAG